MPKSENTRWAARNSSIFLPVKSAGLYQDRPMRFLMLVRFPNLDLFALEQL
jgi:hypothetical protein